MEKEKDAHPISVSRQMPEIVLTRVDCSVGVGASSGSGSDNGRGVGRSRPRMRKRIEHAQDDGMEPVGVAILILARQSAEVFAFASACCLVLIA